MEKIALLITFACSTTLVLSQLEVELRLVGIVIPRTTNAQLPYLPQSATSYSIPSRINYNIIDVPSWVTFSVAGVSDRIEDGHANGVETIPTKPYW